MVINITSNFLFLPMSKILCEIKCVLQKMLQKDSNMNMQVVQQKSFLKVANGILKNGNQKSISKCFLIFNSFFQKSLQKNIAKNLQKDFKGLFSKVFNKIESSSNFSYFSQKKLALKDIKKTFTSRILIGFLLRVFHIILHSTVAVLDRIIKNVLFVFPDSKNYSFFGGANNFVACDFVIQNFIKNFVDKKFMATKKFMACVLECEIESKDSKAMAKVIFDSKTIPRAIIRARITTDSKGMVSKIKIIDSRINRIKNMYEMQDLYSVKILLNICIYVILMPFNAVFSKE